MISAELKPCPFCEADHIALVKKNGVYYMYCQRCNTRGPTSTLKDRAVELWNASQDDDLKKVIAFASGFTDRMTSGLYDSFKRVRKRYYK